LQGDHKFFIPAVLLKDKKVTDKAILKELKAGIPELAQKNVRLGIVSDPRLHEELKSFEASKVRHA